MLSIEQMRKHLDDKNLSDEEVTEIRDGLRALAEIIFEKWQSENKKI